MICNNCGAIWNEEDWREGKNHTCDPADVPAKGKMIRKGRAPALAEDLK